MLPFHSSFCEKFPTQFINFFNNIKCDYHRRGVILEMSHTQLKKIKFI